MDEPALQRLLDDVRSGACTARRGRAPAAAAPLRRPRVRQGRPPPPLRQGLPEAVYGQGKTAEQCAAIVGELLEARRPAAPTVRWPVILTRADADQVELVLADHPGGSRTVTGAATGGDQVRGELVHGGLAAGPAPGGPDPGGHRRDRRPAGGPGVRGDPGGPRAAPDAARRLRRGRGAPAAGVGRRARRGRRGGRGGRHGGRPGQPGRRDHRGAGRGRAHQRRLRRRPRGGHRAAGHARLVRGRASPWSASTTGSAPPARWPGSLP